MNTSTNDTLAKMFKDFPEFSKLELKDRHKYESLTARYPLVSDTSFASLMCWWNTLDSCAVSILNDNLVVSYWIPGSELMSGLSFIGINKVDESICKIFDHLNENGEKPKLVHVPEFVIEHMRYPESFICHNERDFDEYVYEVSKFYPLKHAVSYRRQRVRRFLYHNNEENISVQKLNLAEEENRELLLTSTAQWPKKGINGLGERDDETMRHVIHHADEMGLENVCIFIDGVLHGYLIYDQSTDGKYMIFKTARVSYEIPKIFDYAIYAFARWLSGRGVIYANLDSDLGMPFLRMLKIAMGPVNYVRKYTVRPA